MQLKAAQEQGLDTSAVQTILIVDDSKLQLRIVGSMLRNWGYTVIEASTGAEALAYCQKDMPDLVLSDWMMPVMDGLEFCRLFKDLPKDDYGYFILLTSKSEKSEIAEGLDAGADDFLTKPVNLHELLARIRAGNRVVSLNRAMAAKTREVSEALAKLSEAHEAIDRDLRQARKIQQSLMPDRVKDFGTSRVSLFFEPCGHVGGDLVGMFSPNPDQIAFYNIDVSGHGVTSAMLTARVAGFLSGRFLDQNLGLEKLAVNTYRLRHPFETVALLNDRLCADPGVDEYLTIAYATVDLSSGKVRLVQAGHPPGLIMRQSGAVEQIDLCGLPVGLVPDATYAETEFDLRSGDKLLLYSDGFTEAELRSGKMLEEDGLADLFARCVNAGAQGPEVLDDLRWQLASLMAPGEQLSDDISGALLEFDASLA